MSNQKQHLAMRFGYGLRPGFALPADANALINEAAAASQHTVTITTPNAVALHKKYIDSGRSDAVFEEIYQIRVNGMKRVFVDALNANTGFGDRLAAFWFDHFCVKPVHAERIPLMIAYMQQILRNRMMGTFYNLLEGAIKHPSMLLFLNQDQASGPNSPHQKAAGTRLPANENLARELLELHTLGAGNGYTQQDVAQTSLLLTGLRYTHWTGFQYNTHFAEPGVKTIMGVRYNPNSATPSVEHINTFLRNLSNNPRTIDTICRKLLVHFVSDSVDTIMLDAMKAEWVRTGGNLRAVYTFAHGKPPCFSGGMSGCAQLIFGEDSASDQDFSHANT